MIRNVPLITDNYYHIFNRGVRKGDIFFTKQDCVRWTNLMKWYVTYNYTYSKYLSRVREARIRGTDPKHIIDDITQHHKLLQTEVEIIAYALMPNHFHIVLKQVESDGITQFLHRISNAYTHYFNLKHDLTGALFEGPFKAVLIESEEHLIHVCRYVHLNPVQAGIINTSSLLEYPWTSFPYYYHQSRPSFVKREILLSAFNYSLSNLTEFTFAQQIDDETVNIKDLTIDNDI